MLLCSQHHKLVHEGGYTIDRDYQNQWFFKRPDGKAIPDCGYSAKDMLDDDIGHDDDELSRRAGPRSRPAGSRSKLLNNPSREGLLSDMEKTVLDLGPACRTEISRMIRDAYAGRAIRPGSMPNR